MRSSKSRSRSKNNRNRSVGNIVNRVFDSTGPESKVRGTPQQIIDKYNQLARDAQLSNDRVATENFQQHAEHYTRMLGEAQRDAEARREQQEQQNRGRDRDDTRGSGDQPDARGSGDQTDARGSGDQPDGRASGDQPETQSHDDGSAHGSRNDTPAGDGAQNGDTNSPRQDGASAPAQSGAEPPGKADRPRHDATPGDSAGDVVDMGEQDGGDNGLVDTPESSTAEKPKKPRRTRKPKAAKADTDQPGDAGAGTGKGKAARADNAADDGDTTTRAAE